MKNILLTLSILSVLASAKAAEFSLKIAEEKVNITGKSVTGMTINGGIPGPTLRFTEGDTAVMHVNNSMTVLMSIHWHGLLVPPDMDGVPFISYPPIKPGTTFTYRFPIRQTGTYWYHSHSGLQEQRGLFGSIVILPKEKNHGEDKDHVVVLSDWTDQNPQKILRNLRRASEFFGERKAAGDLPKPFVYDTMMGFNWKDAFALTPAGTMGMPDRDVDAGKFDQPGMNMDIDMGMDMGGMSRGGSMKMPMAMEGMEHSAMDMSGMDHGEMKEPAMDRRPSWRPCAPCWTTPG